MSIHQSTYARIGFSVIVILSVLAGIFFVMRPAVPRVSASPYVGLAWGVVQQVAQKTDGQGRVVLLFDESDITAPVLLKAIHAELEMYPNLTVEAVERLDGYFIDWPEITALPAAQFIELVKRYQDADVIVSFIGVPYLNRNEIAELGTDYPLLIGVYHSTNLPESTLATLSFTDLSVLPPLDKRPLSEHLPTTPQEWFEREFRVIESYRRR
jgi:hypothetical protein